MNKNSQIISFKEAKEKRREHKEEVRKSSHGYPYRGSVTISISGNDVDNLDIVLYSSWFDRDEIIMYFHAVLSSLLDQETMPVIIDDSVLDTYTTIHFYQPHNREIKRFHFDLETPISDDKLIKILTTVLLQS